MKTSERYCPECKQNVDVDGDIFDTCQNCGYAFSIQVDVADIANLIEKLEGCFNEPQRLKAAEDFRAKYEVGDRGHLRIR